MTTTVVAKYKWFNIIELPQNPKRKTRDYKVVNHRGDLLGCIRFYTGWRQHVLVPNVNAETVWSKGCLEDINAFLELLAQRRART